MIAETNVQVENFGTTQNILFVHLLVAANDSDRDYDGCFEVEDVDPKHRVIALWIMSL